MAAPGGVKCIWTQKWSRPMCLDSQVSVRTHWTRKSASGHIGRASQRPDTLGAALSLPDGMSPGGRTQNKSLHYKRLEYPAHKVSGERQDARYFFC